MVDTGSGVTSVEGEGSCCGNGARGFAYEATGCTIARPPGESEWPVTCPVWATPVDGYDTSAAVLSPLVCQPAGMHEDPAHAETALAAAHGRVVTRVGRTVRREAGWWTPAVQALLAHLDRTGFPAAPRPLGIDTGGREVVSFIDGDHGPACWSRIVTDDGLERFGRLLRSYHDAAASFVAPPGLRWKLPALDAGPGTIVCHGDFAPWNLVWRGDEPIGIIDWEFARPRHRLDDLAWAATWAVPLRSDAEAVHGWDCWPSPPDRRRRLADLVDAYGAGTPALVVDRAITVAVQTYHDVAHLAALGLEPQATWAASGVAEEDLARAAWIDTHRSCLADDK